MTDPVATLPVAGAEPLHGPAFTLSELPIVSAVNLRGDGDAFYAALIGAIGAAPPVANRFVDVAGRTIVWLGPDEWLALGAADDADGLEALLAGALPGVGAAVTDVTGNRVAFRIAGEGAHDLLAAGCSLDLHPRAFGPGRCAQTLVARAGVILLQRDALTFDLLVRRSFARYLWDWLASVADLVATRRN